MKILLVYFSATGNTARIAHVIGEKFTELGGIVDKSDITPRAVRTAGTILEAFDAIVFGAPIL